MRRALVALVTAVLLLGVAGAAQSETDSALAARTVTYPGKGVVVHPGELGKLKRTSPSFRNYVKKKLKSFAKPGHCGAGAEIRVRRWSSDGFAAVRECGFGLTRLYVQSDKTWRDPENLAFHPRTTWCWSLRWYVVPPQFAGKRCVSENEQTVTYTDYQLAPDYETPEFAARTLVAIATRRLYESGVAYLWGAQSDYDSPELPVLNTMYEAVADGATLTVPKCFDQNDPDFGSQIAPGEHGCILDAFYGNYRALYVMHLTPYEEGHWWTSRLTGYASS